MEQRTPVGLAASTVAAGEPEHGILYDVERLLAIAGGQLGHAQRAALNAGQEPIQRFT
jgi:hypothetical protein